MSAPVEDRNSLAYWYPRIKDAVPTPETHILEAEADLTSLLDGETPDGFDSLVSGLCLAADMVGWPCFLRTGHGSGKHDWERTCFVRRSADMAQHVGALVEWSHLVDFMGLPTNVWVVRQMLPTEPLFRCEAYGGFPVTREFRLFVRAGGIDGAGVSHVQPYWPPESCEQGRPDVEDWRDLLRASWTVSPWEGVAICDLALTAVRAIGSGYWSVDVLQDRDGGWWVTDMAEGDASFQWDPDGWELGT